MIDTRIHASIPTAIVCLHNRIAESNLAKHTRLHRIMDDSGRTALEM